jgi:hypothetical protein
VSVSGVVNRFDPEPGAIIARHLDGAAKVIGHSLGAPTPRKRLACIAGADNRFGLT